MLIPWLLKYDGYPPGVVVALLLHGILLYIFMPKEFEPADQVAIQPMQFVVASAVKQSPQRLRELNQRRQQEQADAQRERDRQRELQRQRDEAAAAAQQRIAEQQQRERDRAAQQQREREQAAAQERERQRVAEEQARERERERQRQQSIAAEQAAQQAADRARQQAINEQQLSVENQLIAQYLGIIHDLVSGAWNIPPSARNGMLAVVEFRLTPTGEIITRDIRRSSGDGAFDRSVLQAVDRVGRIPELQKLPPAIFERNFRTVTLEFSPEDLLR